MTVTWHSGDLFGSGAHSLVDPVNCLGTSGAGLARAFALRHHDAIRFYKGACRARQVLPGRVPWCWSFQSPLQDPAVPGGRRAKLIYFFPTKVDWRDPSQLGWIVSGLEVLTTHVVEHYRKDDVRSVAIPALGCGHGGLPWTEVRPLLEKAAETMSSAGVAVHLFEHRGPSPRHPKGSRR